MSLTPMPLSIFDSVLDTLSSHDVKCNAVFGQRVRNASTECMMGNANRKKEPCTVCCFLF